LYTLNYTVNNDVIIVSKDYIQNYRETKGDVRLSRYISLLTKFCLIIGKLDLLKEQIEERVKYILNNNLLYFIRYNVLINNNN